MGLTLVIPPRRQRQLSRGFLVTNISYPIVPKGKDEIRVQISASHTKKDIDEFIEAIGEAAKDCGVIAK